MCFIFKLSRERHVEVVYSIKNLYINKPSITAVQDTAMFTYEGVTLTLVCQYCKECQAFLWLFNTC